MKVLLPIILDRWRNPIATLLRACVKENPDIQFYSGSSPAFDEDRQLANDFWSLPNIKANSQFQLAVTKFDLIHTASITSHNQAAVIAAKLRTLGKAKYLATINLQVGPNDGKDWNLLKTAEFLFDGFVAVSEAAGADATQRCCDRFLGIIPNGFDSHYFDPNIEDGAGIPEKILNLEPGSFALFLGALEPRKNPGFIVELAKRHPETTFVGAGYIHPHGRHYEALVHSVPNYHWLGHIDRRWVRALLRRAGVLLFPSEREGLALSVIEALGMGVPVVCQPKTSMPELIQHGVNGMLHDISHIEDWSESMQKYLKRSAEERAAQRDLIRSRMVARYDWSVIGKKYGEIYRKLTNIC